MSKTHDPRQTGYHQSRGEVAVTVEPRQYTPSGGDLVIKLKKAGVLVVARFLISFEGRGHGFKSVSPMRDAGH